MKTASLCLLTIVSAALLSGRAYAARPDNSGPETKPRTEQPEHGRVVSKPRPAIHSPVMNSNRPHGVAKDQPGVAPASPTLANPVGLHASTAVRPGTAVSPLRPNPARPKPALSGPTHNGAINNALPIRPGAQASPGIAASVVRHRDPNAAVIGGSAISRPAVGALDGSQVNLKSSRN
jgi:hypothetical protein